MWEYVPFRSADVHLSCRRTRDACVSILSLNFLSYLFRAREGAREAPRLGTRKYLVIPL